VDRRLCEPQNQSGRDGEEKKSHYCSCRVLNPGCKVHSLVTVLTELSRLLLHSFLTAAIRTTSLSSILIMDNLICSYFTRLPFSYVRSFLLFLQIASFHNFNAPYASLYFGLSLPRFPVGVHVGALYILPLFTYGMTTILLCYFMYGGAAVSFRTGLLERELQMIELSTTICSCIPILWISLVSFPTITLCIASQRVFNFVFVYFVTTQSRNFWIHLRVMQ
jgi:hypothetical protein